MLIWLLKSIPLLFYLFICRFSHKNYRHSSSGIRVLAAKRIRQIPSSVINVWQETTCRKPHGRKPHAGLDFIYSSQYMIEYIIWQCATAIPWETEIFVTPNHKNIHVISIFRYNILNKVFGVRTRTDNLLTHCRRDWDQVNERLTLIWYRLSPEKRNLPEGLLLCSTIQRE